MLGVMPRPSDHTSASSPLSSEEAERIAEVMSAFGTGSRIRLLYALVGPVRSVDELAKFTDLSPSVVSQQLRVLRLYRMVEGRRDGRHVRYSIADEHIVELLSAVRAHIDHVDAPSTGAKGTGSNGP